MAASVPNVKLSNGQNMPILGYGTWKSKSGEVTEGVKVAIDAGYRHIDCAYIYLNEEEVGAGIRAKIEDGTVKREDLFVTSKLWCSRHEYADVVPSLKESLSKLGLDYVDLYLIHWPWALKAKNFEEIFPRHENGDLIFSDVHYLKTWKGMEDCVDAKLTKAIGLSNFNSEQIQDVLDNSRIKPVVNQVEIHPYLSQERLVKFCAERDIAVTAFSPLGSADRPWAMPDEPTLLEDPQLKALGAKYNKSPAQVVLRWVIQRKIITIPKSVTPSRIRENFQLFDFELSDEDMATVNSFNRDMRLVVPMKTVDGKRVYRDAHAPYFPFNIDF